jgi:hypothetical protein
MRTLVAPAGTFRRVATSCQPLAASRPKNWAGEPVNVTRTPA